MVKNIPLMTAEIILSDQYNPYLNLAVEQALLRDYVQGKTTVTLTDDHAIKSAYDEVTALLDRLGMLFLIHR